MIDESKCPLAHKYLFELMFEKERIAMEDD